MPQPRYDCCLLTPWCRVLLEKLTGLQLVKKFPRHFTEPEGSLTHSQASATCLYPGPAQSSPYTHIPPWRSILILSTHLRLGLPSGSFPPVSPKRPHTPPLLTHTCHMPSPSFHGTQFAISVQTLSILCFNFLCTGTGHCIS